jgi:glycosyltransferase involved in cell wall biosynthesis
MSVTIFLVLYILFFAIVLFYQLYFRMRLAFASKRALQPQYYLNIPVSVIICAKNEEVNLKKNLPFVLNQDYENFEVVVVDDNSNDETYFYLKSLQQQYSNLKVIRLTENVNFFSGKKFPLSLGIKSATHNHLLLTDADCRPSTNMWIRLMASGFGKEKQLVLGYGQYDKKKGLLNSLICFETIYTALQYFSFALARMPYMGVGRNLAYTKQLFNAQRGFSKHYNIVSGDDDLFVNAAADKTNTACVIHPDAFTVSVPSSTWSAWWKQKRRHLTTGVWYKRKHKILLSLYPVALVLFYMTMSFAILEHNNFYFVLALLILKVMFDIVIYRKISEKFAGKNLYFISFVFEFLLILVYGMIFFANIFSKQRKWK